MMTVRLRPPCAALPGRAEWHGSARGRARRGMRTAKGTDDHDRDPPPGTAGPTPARSGCPSATSTGWSCAPSTAARPMTCWPPRSAVEPGPAARHHRPVAAGRVRRHRPARPRPGLVLADPGRHDRHRAGLPGRPAPAGPAGARPRGAGRPAVRSQPARTGSSTGRGGSPNAASAAKDPPPARTARTPRSGGPPSRPARTPGRSGPSRSS